MHQAPQPDTLHINVLQLEERDKARAEKIEDLKDLVFSMKSDFREDIATVKTDITNFEGRVTSDINEVKSVLKEIKTVMMAEKTDSNKQMKSYIIAACAFALMFITALYLELRQSPSHEVTPSSISKALGAAKP